jgi:hypothetical protein
VDWRAAAAAVYTRTWLALVAHAGQQMAEAATPMLLLGAPAGPSKLLSSCLLLWVPRKGTVRADIRL